VQRKFCRKKSFEVYTHNVEGLCNSKLEFILRLMKRNGIEAYLTQETHPPGDFEKPIIKDYYLIHHGPQDQPSNEA
jgi:hypothetical protein